MSSASTEPFPADEHPPLADELPAATTTEAAKDIKPIDKDTVHRICSGQVVLNLGVAVKELVENSIDAGATLIEVRLRDQGLDQIEVIDNGHGVDEANFEGLTAKYHTSKIREFADLAGVTTFGFRGEALSSLCALADLHITTRHSTAAIATRLQLDHRGAIVQRTPCARQTGTTIQLANLFATLPVRKREFTKNIRKEFARMCQLLQAYCLVARGVRILCTNQSSKSGARTTVMATAGAATYMENITAVFGPRQRTELLALQTTADEEAANGFGLHGWVSSCQHGAGRSSRDRQFFYVNERPCEPKLLQKVCNEFYHRYNGQQSPFVLLNVTVARSDVDVNLTPDKRQVLVNNEQVLLDVLKTVLLRVFGDVPSTFRMQNLDATFQRADSAQETTLQRRASDDEDDDEQAAPTSQRKFSNILSQWKRTGRTDEPARSPKPAAKRKPDTHIEERNVKMKSVHDYLQQLDEPRRRNATPSPVAQVLTPVAIAADSDDSDDADDADVRTSCPALDTPKPAAGRQLRIQPTDSPQMRQSRPDTPSPTPVASERRQSAGISPIPLCVLDESSTDSTDTHAPLLQRPIPSPGAVELSVTIERIERLMLAECEQRAQRDQRTLALERLRFKAAIDPQRNRAAEQELQTEIGRADFRRMQIIGQFNLGFIVVRLDDDLFIIDQHASDEKYNFERLQQTTRLQMQPMVRPQPLELTAVNEMVLIDNRRVFEMNGFQFEIDELAEPTRKCRLVARPFSANWEFGKEDIDELIFMLHDCSGNTEIMCRPTRIRAMFASRACRKSVMVGTALSVPKMKRLVEQMSEIDHPWNCPHGRPTMRHLLNLAMLEEIPNDGDTRTSSSV